MKLPNMNEFSPGIVDNLGPLLEIVAAHAGSRPDISAAIATQYPLIAATEDDNALGELGMCQSASASAACSDLQANELTPFGQLLRALPPDEQHKKFAAHILTECRGNELLDAIRSLQAERERLTMDVIRQELRERGFEVTTNEGNASKLRMWLEKAGAINSDWNIDERVVSQLLGIEQASRREWEQFTRAQRMLLLVLRHLSVDTNSWLSGSHVKQMIRSIRPWCSARKRELRAAVLNPLRDAGWIETRGERPRAAGAAVASGELRTTAKLLAITAELGLDPPTQGLPPRGACAA